jgi:hypothetical protein
MDATHIPTKKDWLRFAAEFGRLGLVVQDRSTVSTTDVQIGINPDTAIDFPDRTPVQKAGVSATRAKLQLFLTLNQIGYPVAFDEPLYVPGEAAQIPRPLKKRRTWTFDDDDETSDDPCVAAPALATGATAQPADDIGGLLDDLGDDFFDD